MLETQPKVVLGQILTDTPEHYDLRTAEIKQDYAENKDTYTALGVTEKDLEYAEFVRTS